MSATTETAGRYTGTFTWGGSPGIPCELSRNAHGWFCDSVNGQEWVYDQPLVPYSG